MLCPNCKKEAAKGHRCAPEEPKCAIAQSRSVGACLRCLFQVVGNLIKRRK